MFSTSSLVNDDKPIVVGQISNKGLQAGKVYNVNGIAMTLCAGTHGYAMGNIAEPIICNSGVSNPNSKVVNESTEQRIKINDKEVLDTLTTTQKDNYALEPILRIRKLTPLECWKLVGVSVEDFNRARDSLISTHYKGKDRCTSQLYKLAGNSIVTDVTYYIFLELYKSMPYLFNGLKVSSFFSGIGAFEKGLDRLYKEIK